MSSIIFLPAHCSCKLRWERHNRQVIFVFVTLLFSTTIIYFNYHYEKTSMGQSTKVKKPNINSVVNRMDLFDNDRKMRNSKSDKLVVIMIDGFKPSYLKQFGTLKGFNRFMTKGAMAKWMNPVFPSLSFPCWTTLNTGLHPEDHGIIGNHIYEPNLADSEQFNMDEIDSTFTAYWWKTEQIWTTATKQNLNVLLRYWSRCEVMFEGIDAFDCIGYYPGESTVSEFTKNLEDVHQKFDFIDLFMFYTGDLDKKSHALGTKHLQVSNLIKKYDEILFEFLEELDRRNRSDKVNILLLGDHGMADMADDVIVQNLPYFVNPRHIDILIGEGSIMQIIPKPEFYKEVYEDAKKVLGLDVYSKENIPEEFHYKKSEFAYEILLVAQPGFQISTKAVIFKKSRSFKGQHGFPPLKNANMRTILLGLGPAFRPGAVVDPVDMVDVYQMYGKLLNITLNPHNGTWSKVEQMFK